MNFLHRTNGKPSPRKRYSSTPQVSKSAQRLVKAQNEKLRTIMNELLNTPPTTYSKTGHWAWYVWPTQMEGMSDTKRTAVKNIDDADFVVHQKSVHTWSRILYLLAEALKGRHTSDVIPNIDHGRIRHFLKEWPKYSPVLPSEFMVALLRFKDAWKKAELQDVKQRLHNQRF